MKKLATYLPDALEALRPLFVSRAPQRRNSGAAHMDTIYTKPRDGHVLMVEDKAAKKIAKERDVPAGDALHAIIARDDDLILVTRDRHFRKLEDISKHHKPEEII